MTMGQAFFGFNGRLPRGEYFGLSIAAAIVLLIALFLAMTMLRSTSLDLGIGVYLAVSGWASAALVAKRLHDMGMPGMNAAWIVPIQLAAGWYAGRGGFAAIVSLAALGIGLWLLFTRGDSGRNAYGPELE